MTQLQFWAEGIPSRKIFILVSGKAGSGKSTVAKLLLEEVTSLGYSAGIYGFADSLKDAAIDYFGWDGNKDEKGRILLQQIGRVGREYNKDLWVSNLVDEVMNKGLSSPSVVIISDWRFPNEFKYIEDLNFQTLAICVNAPNRETLKDTPYYNDISETSLPDIDDVLYDTHIDNSGDIETTKQKVRKLVETYFQKETI